jgi:hypothetical protein
MKRGKSKQSLRLKLARHRKKMQRLNIIQETVLKGIKCENYHDSLNIFELHFVFLICLGFKHFPLKMWTKHSTIFLHLSNKKLNFRKTLLTIERKPT